MMCGRKIRMVILLLTAVMIFVSFTGCAPDEPVVEPDAPDVDEIVIGHVHPLTGALALEGNEMRDAVQMAVDEVNEAGGIQSLGGAPVRLLHGDVEFNPELGASETERLIREGAVGILGAYASSIVFTATAIAEREQVPFVVTVAVADNITERGFQYTFRVQPNAYTMAYYHSEYLKMLNDEYDAGIENILVIHEESLFGATISDHLVKFSEEAGLNIVDTISYSAATGDLSTEVDRVLARNPDIIVHVGYFRDGVLFLNTANDRGVEIPVIACASGAMSHPKMPGEVGEYAEGLLDVNYRDNPISPESQTMHDRYLEQFGTPMSTHAIYAYAAARVLLEAIEQAGSDNPQDIRDALAAMEYQLPILPYLEDSTVRFDEKGECATSRSPMMQVQDGEIKVVFPEEVAEAELIWPTN